MVAASPGAAGLKWRAAWTDARRVVHDRWVIRQFEEETNLECHILLDQSASMAYRGAAPMTKLEYGSVLAASLPQKFLSSTPGVNRST